MKKSQLFIFLCFLVALISTAGSLFFSEVMKFPPCVLCWYQRIAMYPLVLLFLAGSFQGAKATWSFTMPLVAVGWIIAVWHNLLHYKIVPESASPCMEGVSCATVYIQWFGFITIPMLSFFAFSILLGVLLLLKKELKNEQ